MFGPTQRQNDALTFLRTFRVRHGKFPSFEEIAQGIGVRGRAGIMRLLRGLEERGHIRRLPNKARAIEIVEHDRSLVVFQNLKLPPDVQAKLDAYCEASGERPDDVIADAITLHFDQLETAPEAA